VLFVKGVLLFDPLHHQPHPPGFPLLIGLGKLGNLFFHDPFASLVALSVLSSLVGYLALVDAFRRMAPISAGGPGGMDEAERVAIVGAALFQLSPAMLVYGPLALSEPPALLFLSLALAAAARLREGVSLLPALGLGTAASAAIGCRPQLAVAVLPMLAVALWPARRELRRLAAGVGAFAAVSLLWFVPLVVAVGGPGSLGPFLAKQAGLVARYDAAEMRAGEGGPPIAVRFLAHPWGPRWTSVPVLGLAAAGGVALIAARKPVFLPLAVLSGVDLAFALKVMNPQDAVRYALPSMLLVAFAAAVGIAALARLARVPNAVWPVAGLFAVCFLVYTGPLLAVRTRVASPPIQAIRWIARSVPKNAVLLVDKELAPHTSHFFPELTISLATPGLEAAGRYRPDVPVLLLGNGASRWPGAVSFEWPESDAWRNLTRGAYRVVSVSPLPGEGRYAALYGVGGYEPGILAPEWRWLAPEAAIRIGLPPGAPPGRLAVTLGLPRFAPSPSVPVTVAVAGAAPQIVSVPREGRQTVVLPLPAGAKTDEIQFRTPVSFVPADIGLGADRRRLAVQLLGVARLPG
jgi:hypothetical protein